MPTTKSRKKPQVSAPIASAAAPEVVAAATPAASEPAPPTA